jgi:hypothetical protein
MNYKITAALGISVLALQQAGAAVFFSYVSEADTRVVNSAPATNYGTETTMRLQNASGTNPNGSDVWSIMRFDKSTFEGSLGTVELRLTQTTRNGAYELYSVADGGTDESFNETTYTFGTSAYAATLPGTGDGSLNVGHADLSLLGSFSTTVNPETVSISNANLFNFVKSDTNDVLTFVLLMTTQTTSPRYFATREDSTPSERPTLLISAAVPEPSSLALLGLGALVISGRRFRRYSQPPQA